jgi:hypothetical protein
VSFSGHTTAGPLQQQMAAELTPHFAECGVLSSRKGREDNYARVQPVQVGPVGSPGAGMWPLHPAVTGMSYRIRYRQFAYDIHISSIIVHPDVASISIVFAFDVLMSR